MALDGNPAALAAPRAGASAPAGIAPAGSEKLRKVAEEYEAVFLSQMIEAMSAGLKADGPFGGGPGEGVFRSMLNQEYGKAISKSGGIGIADAVYREMLRIQESHS